MESLVTDKFVSRFILTNYKKSPFNVLFTPAVNMYPNLAINADN